MRAEPAHRAFRVPLVDAKSRARDRRLGVTIRMAAPRDPRPRGLKDVLHSRVPRRGRAHVLEHPELAVDGGRKIYLTYIEFEEYFPHLVEVSLA